MEHYKGIKSDPEQHAYGCFTAQSIKMFPIQNTCGQTSKNASIPSAQTGKNGDLPVSEQ